MGKLGSEYCTFVTDGLKVYPNLKKLSDTPKIFSLRHPSKTKVVPADEKFFKDWRFRKGLPYEYSKSKQAVKTLMKKSCFLQVLKSNAEVTIFQMLNVEEIIAKKKKNFKNIKKEYNPTSVGSSGYGSGCEEDVDEELPMTAPSPEQSQTLSRPSDSYEELNIRRHSNENNLCIDPNVIQIDSRNPVTPCLEKMCQDYLFDYESPNLNIQDYFHDVDIDSSANSLEELMETDIQSLEMDSSKIDVDEEFASSENGEFLKEDSSFQDAYSKIFFYPNT